MGAEGRAHDGIHIWSDMFLIEAVDEKTGETLPPGRIGSLCQTPLWTGHATPLLRWNSGDLVTLVEEGASDGPYAAVFPMIRHANRTTGFFKIRGVNVNHSEFEDFMFKNPVVNDFQAVLRTEASALETLEVRIEVKRGAAPDAAAREVVQAVKRTFEVSPEVTVLDLGTLAKNFESSIKAPRFVDERT
jgi:phenylacetate-CoA ligase